jgi:hypothetical protein
MEEQLSTCLVSAERIETTLNKIRSLRSRKSSLLVESVAFKRLSAAPFCLLSSLGGNLSVDLLIMHPVIDYDLLYPLNRSQSWIHPTFYYLQEPAQPQNRVVSTVQSGGKEELYTLQTSDAASISGLHFPTN